MFTDKNELKLRKKIGRFVLLRKKVLLSLSPSLLHPSLSLLHKKKKRKNDTKEEKVKKSTKEEYERK